MRTAQYNEYWIRFSHIYDLVDTGKFRTGLVDMGRFRTGLVDMGRFRIGLVNAGKLMTGLEEWVSLGQV